MTSSVPAFSIVIPVYRSYHTLHQLVERITRVFERDIQESYEILLVDDGSPNPETWPTCLAIAEAVPQLKAIRLARNFGKANAVLCGLQQSRGQYIVTMDDDLQHRPEDICRLAEYRNHDVVMANFENRRHSSLVIFGSWIKNWFDRVVLKLPCRISPFKLIRREIVLAMLEVKTPYPFIPALLATATMDFVSVSAQHESSGHPKSRFNLKARLKQLSHLLIGNSNLLLRVFGLLGSVVALSGFLFAITVLLRRLSGDEIMAGWASLIVINLVFGGLTLIALGIVGEYLIRILESTTKKPSFVIREVVCSDLTGE